MKNKTILLVEDEAVTGFTLSKQLSGCGYNVVHCLSGEEAIETALAKESNINLILMDIDLGPGMDGTEAAKKILKEKDIPVVFISNHTSEEVIEKTEKITSYGYILKNTPVTVIEASIKMALKLFETKQALQESNNRNNAILQALPDMMFVFDRNGKFIDVHTSNPKDLLMLPNEFIGKYDKDILPEQLAILNREKINDLFKTNKPQYYTYKLELDGKVRHFDARMVKFGKDKVLSIVRNITEKQIVEEKLRLFHETYKELLNSISEAIYIQDENGVFLDVNETASVFYSIPREEIIGKTPEFLSAPGYNDLDKLREHHIKAFNGEPQLFEFWGKKADGTAFPKEVVLSRGYYFGKQVVIAVGRNISERKQAEENLRKSEGKYRLIFEKSPLGVFHFDTKGIITQCNDHFETVFGTKKDKLRGLNLKEIPNREVVNAVQKVLRGQPSSYEGMYSFVTVDKTIPVRFLFSPLFNASGNIDGGIGLIEDISSKIEKEKLQKQIVIAEESVKFKQKFLANMSHEIRTPLTGMLGFTELLDKTGLTQKQQSYVDVLKHTGENLKEIINLILDYSKIESGQVKLKYNTFETQSIFEDSINLFRSVCKKDVTLETNISSELPEYIETDQRRLNQIINNLLSNAINFTEEGKIVLNAKMDNEAAADKDHVLVKIEVTDTGIGISPDVTDSLFKPFTQLESSDVRHVEGTGLGLAISKELTKILGGEIGVNSEPGKGSKFWFTFKARKKIKADLKATKDLRPAVVEQSVESSAINILLVDDTKTNQAVVSLMLESMGHKVEFASNGKEALEKFKPGLYDLVLMDIQMPVMDGITATKKLKEKYSVLPPIVGLSANAFEGDREKFMKQGMDDYLTKPVKSEDFKALLNKYFK